MADLLELALDGAIDLGVVVPVKIRPDRGVGIEIGVPFVIGEKRPFPGSDHDGLALKPVLHLGERVPDVLLVELAGIVCVGYLLDFSRHGSNGIVD